MSALAHTDRERAASCASAVTRTQARNIFEGLRRLRRDLDTEPTQGSSHHAKEPFMTATTPSSLTPSIGDRVDSLDWSALGVQPRVYTVDRDS
jgi:hypothetical protein